MELLIRDCENGYIINDHVGMGVKGKEYIARTHEELAKIIIGIVAEKEITANDIK